MSASGEPGLTKRALAQSLGRHESKASRFESGTRAPSERDLRAWCSGCGAEGETENLIMAGQLGYLLSVMALPSVSIGIIPQRHRPKGLGPLKGSSCTTMSW
ncbi:helix-turn-helix domain-containing protein [Streptomyces sp. NPDC051014]|uniref:helix-turn-helix domain-containing protein n=1 Tax=Streptomyces sp. NPDC051014 TaxID=3155751 RepID=UPI0033FA3992